MEQFKQLMQINQNYRQQNCCIMVDMGFITAAIFENLPDNEDDYTLVKFKSKTGEVVDTIKSNEKPDEYDAEVTSSEFHYGLIKYV